MLFISRMTTATIPFTAGGPMIISGPTGSGKTYFVHKLMKYHNFQDLMNQSISFSDTLSKLLVLALFKLSFLIFGEGNKHPNE